jgi:hypothetical protein
MYCYFRETMVGSNYCCYPFDISAMISGSGLGAAALVIDHGRWCGFTSSTWCLYGLLHWWGAALAKEQRGLVTLKKKNKITSIDWLMSRRYLYRHRQIRITNRATYCFRNAHTQPGKLPVISRGNATSGINNEARSLEHELLLLLCSHVSNEPTCILLLQKTHN